MKLWICLALAVLTSACDAPVKCDALPIKYETHRVADTMLYCADLPDYLELFERNVLMYTKYEWSDIHALYRNYSIHLEPARRIDRPELVPYNTDTSYVDGYTECDGDRGRLTILPDAASWYTSPLGHELLHGLENCYRPAGDKDPHTHWETNGFNTVQWKMIEDSRERY